MTTTKTAKSPLESPDDQQQQEEDLTFAFRNEKIPVKRHPSISRNLAVLALESEPFQTWCRRCAQPHGDKRIEIQSVELQSVDLFGSSRVGFVKLQAHCTLHDGDKQHEHRLPGICFLRGNGVSILVALCCVDDGKTYSLLVDQPRIPIGQVSTLELPAGMIDLASDGVAGVAAKEMEEECGIVVRASELIDLTDLACQEAVQGGYLPYAGVCPSPGGCDEFIRLMYLEKKVTQAELTAMKGRLVGLRDEGEVITLRVVPLEDVWRISADAKAMCSLFLLDRLRQDGKLPPLGELATPLCTEPTIQMSNGISIPQLAFGLYKVPDTEEGENIILNAIAAGYRHFDTAAYYGNEATLGRALKKSGIPRKEFFVCTKVWNDAQKQGRASVRQSVEESLAFLDYGDYLDLLLIHWPVPGCFVETYKELELLHSEGKLRGIGLSNFSPEEYEELVSGGITITPVVNQLEVSPFMYRPNVVQYFQERGILVSASKALHRGDSWDHETIAELATKYSKTPAQIMLRWSLQKGLIVVSKTATASRMTENRAILSFVLSDDDMSRLDALTTPEGVRIREELEIERKTSL